MKITVKARTTKFYKKLVEEEVPKAVEKYHKRKKFSKEEAEILETNLRLQLANGTYSPTPAKIYTRSGTKFAKEKNINISIENANVYVDPNLVVRNLAWFLVRERTRNGQNI